MVFVVAEIKFIPISFTMTEGLKYFNVLLSNPSYFKVHTGTLSHFWVLYSTSGYFEALSDNSDLLINLFSNSIASKLKLI